MSAWRARLNWLDMASLGGASLAPYGAYTKRHSRVAAYTETRGGFPVAFAAPSERRTWARAGVELGHRSPSSPPPLLAPSRVMTPLGAAASA